MASSPDKQQLRQHFFQALLEATFLLQTQGPDQEVTLEALIEAVEMLRDDLEQELQELRQEQAE